MKHHGRWPAVNGNLYPNHRIGSNPTRLRPESDARRISRNEQPDDPEMYEGGLADACPQECSERPCPLGSARGVDARARDEDERDPR
jgi:hypothetical protein